MLRDRPLKSSGFTLLEMMTAVAIVGVVAALTVGGLDNLKARTSFSAGTGDLVTSMRKTRAEAFGRGTYTAFIIDTVGGRWWGIEAPNGFNLDTFNPATPGAVIVSGTLPRNTAFGPVAGYGQALPAPFDSINVTGGASSFAYCSFCRTAGNNTGFGEILFEPAGLARFEPTASASIGQQFTIQGKQGNGTRTLAVALIARSGVMETFEL